MISERHLRLRTEGDKADAVAFLSRAIRAGDASVIRLSARSDGLVGLWTTTGFDILATRSVMGEVVPGDIVCDAQTLRDAVARAAVGEPIDPGFGLDSAWRGALPGSAVFEHLDDVPARTIVSLARDGAEVARNEGSAHGPATGLLDQTVLSVTGSDADPRSADVSMRSVFALTSMGFIRDAAGHEVTESSPIDAIVAEEPVRIRVSGGWVRLDARFGSVYQRRTKDLLLTPG